MSSVDFIFGYFPWRTFFYTTLLKTIFLVFRHRFAKIKTGHSLNDSMKNLTEIREILTENKAVLEKEFGVKEINIFGSYARNEQRRESDLDVLVDFIEPIGLLKFIELENHLSDLLGLKVELVTRKALKPRIGESIIQELVRV